jgi:hypothetical protein
MNAILALLVLVAASPNSGVRPAQEVARRHEPTHRPSTSSRDRIVNHTAYFAGESGFDSQRYNTAQPPAQSTYDRYTNPAGASPAVSPPPSVTDRAQLAITETAAALQEGIEAGIQAANDQLSRTGEQVLDASRSAGQQLGQQVQQWTSDPGGQLHSATNDVRIAAEQSLGAMGNQFQQTTNPFATSSSQQYSTAATQGGVSPPPPRSSSPAAATGFAATSATNNVSSDPTASQGMVPARTATGWSAINSNVGAPPLIVPQMSAPTRSESFGNAAAQPGLGGFRSETANNPATIWGTQAANSQATISRNGTLARPGYQVGEPNLVAVRPVESAVSQNSQPAAGGRPESYPWPQFPQANTVTEIAGGANSGPAAAWNTAGQQQVGVANSTPPAGLPFASQTGNATSQSPFGNSTFGAGQANAAQQSPGNASAPHVDTASAEPPWMPFLVVTLSLVGSLSANLFLGWSYLEARHKYESLVRRTADTFRRISAVAA